MSTRTNARGDMYERIGRRWRLIYKAPSRPGKAIPRASRTSILAEMLETEPTI